MRRRRCEEHINSFPQFRIPIRYVVDNDNVELEMEIHFMALFSQKKDAVPLIFLHGWPGTTHPTTDTKKKKKEHTDPYVCIYVGSFLEFLPILALFRDEFSPQTYRIISSCPLYPVMPSRRLRP